MMTDKIKSPIVSRNKKDPTQSYKSLNKTYRNIENRFYEIKLSLKQLFDSSLIGQERDTNNSFIFQSGIIYQVNANYIYDLSPQELSTLLERAQDILDKHLLEGGSNDLWAFSAIEDEYRRGTHSAFTNLSYQSDFYAQQTTLSSLLARPAYLNQLQQAFILTYNDWKGFTEKAKSDLSSVLGNSIARGVNPRETAKIISKRLDICLTRAKTMAQTEQLGAYRDAQMNETEWSSERLGLKTGLLHQSALLSTSRTTHVYWHSKIRTVEEVRQWFTEDGNQFNCHCALTPVLLDENNEPYNKAAIERLSKERDKWFDDNEKPLTADEKQSRSSKNIEFSNIKDAEDWAIKTIADDVNLPNSVSIDAINEMLKTTHETMQRFDVDKLSHFGYITSEYEKLYAINKFEIAAFYLPKSRKLLINESEFRLGNIKPQRNQINEAIKLSRDKNYRDVTNILSKMNELPYSVGNRHIDTVIHELGHAVYYSNLNKFTQLAEESFNKGYGLTVSMYSNSNKIELIAESFTLYVNNTLEAKKRLYPPLFDLFIKLDKRK